MQDPRAHLQQFGQHVGQLLKQYDQSLAMGLGQKGDAVSLDKFVVTARAMAEALGLVADRAAEYSAAILETE